MDSIRAVAAYSAAQSTEQVKSEAGIQVLKKAQEQDAMVLELLTKTFQAVATGLGRNLDVKA
jgi:hypothetical protein